MLEIEKAKYISDYKIEILFNNNDLKVVDLSKSLKGPVFEPLQDTLYFSNFRINFNTLEWPNGADFAPEYLHSIGKPIRKSGQKTKSKSA